MADFKSNTLLPVAFIFHPKWWHKHYGLSFEREFFFDPDTRVEADLKMRKILNKRFGRYHIEKETDIEARPCIGAVHLAAGYIISEMFGCDIKFSKDSSPQVIPKDMTDEETDQIEPVNLTENKTFQELNILIEQLKKRFGYVTGDINWQGVLNVALDLRGDKIFIDMVQNKARARKLFHVITETIKEFVIYIKSETGTSSISVNRTIKFVDPELYLHSNCSVVMISPDMYQDLLLEYDIEMSSIFQPYGIHHCGNNMHVHAEGYAKVKGASFFDVGWGSNISICRQKLPDAFLNLRYDPVKIRNAQPQEIRADIQKMITQSADLEKTGVCCINMGWDVPDENIIAIIDTVNEYRNKSKCL